MERIIIFSSGVGLALVIGAAGLLFGPQKVLAFFGAVFVLSLGSGMAMLFMAAGEEAI